MSNKVIENAFDALQKALGKENAIMLDQKPDYKGDIIPSGNILLDSALGIGGYPSGRIIEIYGPESSGKTTLAIHAMAECQKKGGNVAFIDVEHAFDRDYAKALGVDNSKVIFAQPMSGETALEAIEVLVRNNMDLVVLDSVAALVPQAEIDGDMGDSKMGLQARLMSQAMRKLTSLANRNQCTIIFINQLRSKIGVVYGSPEVTTGGNALKYYASMRLEVRKSGSTEKDRDGNAVANPTKVKVVKNKLAPPYSIVTFEIIFGEGIDNFGSILDLAVELGIIKKSGSWYSYNDSKIGQGKATVRQFLKDNEELVEEIMQEINKKLESGEFDKEMDIDDVVIPSVEG